MPSSVTAGQHDRYTVAGLIRHLARVVPNDEMLVFGVERRTWGQEFDAGVPGGTGDDV